MKIAYLGCLTLCIGACGGSSTSGGQSGSGGSGGVVGSGGSSGTGGANGSGGAGTGGTVGSGGSSTGGQGGSSTGGTTGSGGASTAGQIDRTFGTFGYKATTAGYQQILKSVGVPARNQVYVFATTPQVQSTPTAIFGRTIRRFDYEGNWDQNYGTSGTATLYEPNELELVYSGFGVDSAGRAYVAGWAMGNGGQDGVVLTRFTDAGAVDSAYGTGGRLTIKPTTSFPSSGFTYLQVRVLQVLADDGLLLAGTAENGRFSYASRSWVVFKLNSAGAIDTSFGTNGLASLASGVKDEPNVLHVSASGDIYVAGRKADQSISSVVYKLSSAGVLDQSFGTAGKATFGTSDKFIINDLAVDGSGAVFGVGAEQSTGVIVKLLANGTPDSGFGTAGKATINYYEIFPGADNYIENMTRVWLAADGKVYVGGFAYTTTSAADFLTLARLNANGSPDTSFYASEYLSRITYSSLAVNLTWDYPGERGVALPTPDGKYVLTFGRQNNTSVNSFMRWKLF